MPFSTRSGSSAPDSNGVRKLEDGRPMELIVETAGEDSEQSDVLELVRDSWRKIGFRHPHQAVGSGGLAQSDLLGRGADDDLVRDRERRPDGRLEPERFRPHEPGGSAAMAQMGPILRDEGAGRRAARRSGCQAAARAVPGLERLRDHGAAPGDLEEDARHLCARMLHDRHRGQCQAADRHAPEHGQRAEGGSLQLGSSCPDRHLST